MEEKFYISNLYKVSILFLLIFVSYGPLISLINGQVNVTSLFIALLWFINLNFWLNPIVIFTDIELTLRPTPYYKKIIILKEIKSVEVLGSGSMRISFNETGKIKKQVLLPLKDQQKLLNLIKSRISEV